MSSGNGIPTRTALKYNQPAAEECTSCHDTGLVIEQEFIAGTIRIEICPRCQPKDLYVREIRFPLEFNLVKVTRLADNGNRINAVRADDEEV